MNYIIETEGLHCGHCDASVESALLSIDGVTEADADHETNVVEVACADSVTVEALIAAIEGAGEGFGVLTVKEA